jgi:hypothetical protein
MFEKFFFINVEFQVIKNTALPVADRKIIKASIDKISWTARRAMRRSALRIKKSLESSTDITVREQERNVIISDLATDLSVCGLHGAHYHDQCRPETCRPIPTELETEFKTLCQTTSEKDFEPALKDLLAVWPETKNKVSAIIKQVKARK